MYNCKKQFSSEKKTAYYAQVEAMSLMKKDNETVRHFALRVQQLVKKGWCNESASTINLKNNEIFTKGFPKKLKDFTHRRQVKHVSTILESSIPFHTLFRHVDFEDIANEIISTNDLALEINKVSIEDDQELLNIPLYYTSVGNPVIHKKIEKEIKMIILLETTTVIDIIKIITLTLTTDIETTIDIEATVEIIHKVIIDLTLDKDITIDLKAHTHLDPDMTIIIKKTPSRSPYRSPYRNSYNYIYI